MSRREVCSCKLFGKDTGLVQGLACYSEDFVLGVICQARAGFPTEVTHSLVLGVFSTVDIGGQGVE